MQCTWFQELEHDLAISCFLTYRDTAQMIKQETLQCESYAQVTRPRLMPQHCNGTTKRLVLRLTLSGERENSCTLISVGLT